MKVKEAREILKNNKFEILVPIITKNEMKKVENAVELAFRSLGLLEKVVDVVFGDDYPEYKEEHLVELLEPYVLNKEVDDANN